MDRAIEMKSKGNDEFKKSDFKGAVKMWDEALKLLDIECEEGKETSTLQSQLHSNKAEAYLRLDMLPEVLDSAKKAIEIDPKAHKAYFRRARALERRGQHQQAINDLDKAREIVPDNNNVAELREKCLRCLEKQEGKPYNLQHGILEPEEMERPSRWAQNFSPSVRYEWLVDCYRMRVDDDVTWGGGSGLMNIDLGHNVHGLYQAERGDGAMEIVRDFLLFCKLCDARKALPSDWEWKKFLQKALTLLVCAFEKSDAKAKWGGENVFSGMLGGRPSLRFTANQIYGVSVCDGTVAENEGGLRERVENEVQEALGSVSKVADFLNDSSDNVIGLCREVGGFALWKKLAQKVQKKYLKL